MSGRKISVTFWGTRGSIPSPGKDKAHYGGNTSCIEVRLPNHHLIILDGGTGIRELGNALMRSRKKIHASIFLSHYHWDHIQGLPFFTPAYHAGNVLTIVGADHPEFPLEKILSSQMESIHFPAKLSSLSAHINFKHISLGTHSLEETEIHTMRTNHPGVNFSYSFMCDNKKLVYMTDNELLPHTRTAQSHIAYERDYFIRFIQGADLLIHDAQYSDLDYRKKKGWGHSTWREAAKLAAEGMVKHLILFHHDPNHPDALIDSFVQECRKELKKMNAPIRCTSAREGKTITM
jgi:phosphoribosyl 1,2-cyclic phosphodiesterase